MARLKVSFSYPMLHRSLRSGLEGYQFYEVAFEGVMTRQGASIAASFISIFVYFVSVPLFRGAGGTTAR